MPNAKSVAQDNLIYKIRTGSYLYGTNTPESDEDFMGIFIPTADYVLGLYKVEQVDLSHKVTKTIRNGKEDIDFTAHALPKFFHLLIENNPNIIESLYADEKNILVRTEYGNLLRENRSLFLSKKAYSTFKGYAYSQRNKLMVKRDNMTGRTELALKFGYDVKFASHLIRILLECVEIFSEKTITFPLHENNMVRDIKLGKFDLTWVIDKSIELEKRIDFLCDRSDLQHHADIEKINSLQKKIMVDYWKSKGETS